MRKIVLAFAAVVIFLAACKKNDDLGTSRLFRPVLKGPLVSEGNWIAASWQVIKGAESYTVQLSKDTFRTVLASVTLDSNAYLFQNLEWNRRYQVQVKANSADSTLNSRMSYLGEIKTAAFPTILNTPTISEIGDNAVKVSWVNSGAAVTSIKILKTADSSVVSQVTLNATDITNQYRIVSGLTGLTGYTIFLYSGTTVRGWADFTTKATLAGSIIDLREITGRPSVLSDTIPIIASGSIILLKRGETYALTANLSLDKSLTFISGNDLLNPNQAIISMPFNFTFASGSTVDSVVFKDVYLKGTDYASKYIFNVNSACTVGKISFESCRAEIVRGFLRMQTNPSLINTVNINNCIIDSVAGFGVVNVDIASSKIENIILRNSTFYKVEKLIVSRNNSTSVTVENCTFNETLTAGSYYIDYSTAGTNNVTQPIIFKNNILGRGKSQAAILDLRGYRVGSASSIDVSNTFATSDFLSTNVTYQFPNLTVYPKLSTEIFQDPYNGNFKIIDNAFPGKSSAGDPRWRL